MLYQLNTISIITCVNGDTLEYTFQQWFKYKISL